MTKKVVLLLVEGPTDESALALSFSRLVKDKEIVFAVLHTDITAGEDMTAKYIGQRIQGTVDEYLRKNPFIERSDILKIVEIIDTDGAFIPASMVLQSASGKTEYSEDRIYAKDKNRLQRRNISKRAIVYKLVRTEMIHDYPYEIYYFSRNLEHALHGRMDELTDEEKEDLAFEIADRYSDEPEKFLELLYSDKLHVPGNYMETWDYIMRNGNSLQRHSNVSLFFERIGIMGEREKFQ